MNLQDLIYASQDRHVRRRAVFLELWLRYLRRTAGIHPGSSTLLINPQPCPDPNLVPGELFILVPTADVEAIRGVPPSELVSRYPSLRSEPAPIF